MGLFITAYKNIRPATADEILAGQWSFFATVADKDFAVNIELLEKQVYYMGEKTALVDMYSYRAFNDFRRYLAKSFIGVPAENIWRSPRAYPQDLPFFRLINFADNEGVMDWGTMRILKQDFERYAQTMLNDTQFGFHHYLESWLELTALASDENCAIKYH